MGGGPAYTVLIVDDDDQEIKDIISDYLTKQGCGCETASSGDEALGRIAATRFDAVITDLRMTGMDGIALTRETLKQAPHMPIMVMTGFVDEYSEREAIDAGAREFITKPFALAEFSARFHKMMRDHAALMELKDEERRKRGELVTALQRESDEKIEDLKREIDDLKELAYYDVLTGLPNRMLFIDRLNHAIQLAKRYVHKLALLFLDLDRFKDINDSLGHDTGDLLLKEVGVRLTGLVRRADTVARMGGDEFAVIVSHVARDGEAASVARRIVGALRRPFILKDHECSVGASVGIGIFPRDGRDAETLLKNADIAMYRVKERGRNNYCLFSRK